MIRNTVFRDNGGYGVSVAGAAETTIDNVHAERNALAGFSLVGTKGTVSNSVTNDNSGPGISISAPSLATATLAISDHASANNVGSGVDAFVNAAAQVYVTLSRSTLSGNTQHGARASTTGQGTVRMVISYSQIQGNAATGVTADTGVAVALLHGNTVSNSPIGVQGLAGAQVRSVGNNSIVDNTIDTGAGYFTYVPN